MNKVLIAIKNDLKVAMKNEIDLRRNKISEGNIYNDTIAQKTVSRAIISMIPSLNKKPDETTNDDIFKLLKKYINQEKELYVYQAGYLTKEIVEGKSSTEIKKLVAIAIKSCENESYPLVIEIAQKYLPTQATEKDIIEWINDNIDFNEYKNKMQTMKPIMQQFKGCDGNFVKNILLNL